MRNSSRLARLERQAPSNYADIDVTQLSDEELDALIASIPRGKRAWWASMTDEELENIIATAEGR